MYHTKLILLLLSEVLLCGIMYYYLIKIRDCQLRSFLIWLILVLTLTGLTIIFNLPLWGIVIVALTIILSGYCYNNAAYHKQEQQLLAKLGFQERQFVTPGGNIINYGQGPDNGTPLLLIHGQTLFWQIFIKVLPALSKKYQVFAADCYGHGKSSHKPELYTIETIGNDLALFIQKIIKQPVLIAGNSSGGLIAAWLAANRPQLVKGIILEDPPLFSAEMPRCKTTEVWQSSFKVIAEFTRQSGEKNFTTYVYTRLAATAPTILKPLFKLIVWWQRHWPAKPIFFLPAAFNKRLLSAYDPNFGAKVYDCSWFINFDHAQTLAAINCPALLIHVANKPQHDSQGRLLAAMSDEDAARAKNLLVQGELVKVKATHCINESHPKLLVNLINSFYQKNFA